MTNLNQQQGDPARPHILHIIETLRRGGAELQLIKRISALPNQRHTICTVYGHNEFVAELADLRVPVHSLNLPRWTRIGPGVRALRALMRRERFDLVHTSLFAAGLLGRLAAGPLEIPLVTSLEAAPYEPEIHQDHRGFSPWRHEVVRQLESWSGRRWNRAFVAVSRYVADSSIRRLRYNPARVEVIYNGLSLADYEPAPPRQRPGAEPVELLNIGRLDSQKGQGYLLQALAEVRRVYPNSRLRIVGAGPAEAHLRSAIAEHRLGESVELLGRRRDVPALLRETTLFAFPSLAEGLPIAALEALACGVPMVASDIAPHREILDPGVQGLLVPPRDAAALAAALLALLGDEERRLSMGQAGRRRVEERFTIEQTARQMEQLYLRLLETRP